MPRGVALMKWHMAEEFEHRTVCHSALTVLSGNYVTRVRGLVAMMRHLTPYKKKAAVNWCPTDKTVLANEQVEGGKCERCGAEVEQRFLAQWFFRITDYAERLLHNIDGLDWSNTTRTAQRTWIGKSEGAELTFRVVNPLEGAGSAAVHETSETMASHGITVFTTRPDTIFGATYLVLSPEHPLLDDITSPDQRDAVVAYRAQAARQDLVTRKTNREKTGAFTGAYAVNPATGELIPVWTADYVLMEYGTGAIMAVPGHDERDFEFARAFGLPIERVVMGPGQTARTPLDAAFTDDAGAVLCNSDRFDGYPVGEAKRAVTAWLEERHAGKAVINYRLHDWCISRQRYWGPPIPIIHCGACGPVPVPDQDLPVLLPNIADFKPDDSGVSPLARHEEWYRVPCPQCGKPARRETDVSDTFLDSGWYFLRYPSVRAANAATKAGSVYSASMLVVSCQKESFAYCSKRSGGSTVSSVSRSKRLKLRSKSAVQSRWVSGLVIDGI